MTSTRFKRLKAALQRGETIADFARTEGVTPQAITDWLDRRPDYAAQLRQYRRGRMAGLRAPICGQEFWSRAQAIRTRLETGARWKVVARELGLNDAALRQWFKTNRTAVLKAIAELQERRAA